MLANADDIAWSSFLSMEEVIKVLTLGTYFLSVYRLKLLID